MFISNSKIKKTITICVTITILFMFGNCDSAKPNTDIAILNRDYARETFYAFYTAKKSDLAINVFTDEWGYLSCGECTYYEFDSYSTSSNNKSLFHNIMVIRTSDNAISWFIYDDSDFSTYMMKENLDIDAHSKKHQTSPSNSDTFSVDYAWWEDYGRNIIHEEDGMIYTEWITVFKSNSSEYKARYILLSAVENRDGSYSLTFSCSGKKFWNILRIQSFEGVLDKESQLFSYTGKIYDEYRNGEIYSSGADATDTINIIFNPAKEELVVTSLLELSGYNGYPTLCSGTYSLDP